VKELAKLPDRFRSIRKYDWDKLLSGTPWELHPGKDISSIGTFRVLLCKTAKQMNIRYTFRTEKKPDGTTVGYLQAFPEAKKGRKG